LKNPQVSLWLIKVHQSAVFEAKKKALPYVYGGAFDIFEDVTVHYAMSV